MRRLVPRFTPPGPGASQHPVPRSRRYYRFVRLLLQRPVEKPRSVKPPPVAVDPRYHPRREFGASVISSLRLPLCNAVEKGKQPFAVIIAKPPVERVWGGNFGAVWLSPKDERLMTDRFLTKIDYRGGEFQFARCRVAAPFGNRAIV